MRPYRRPTKAQLVACDTLLTLSVLLFVFVFLSGVFFWGRVLVRAIFQVPRKRPPPPPSPLDGLKAKVMIERNGATVCIEDVDAAQSFTVLAELLEAMRLTVKAYPELVQEPTPVGGGSIEYVDDDEWEGRKVGFR